MAAIIPHISKLSTRIIRILGCNPGPMTLQGTNTYLVGTGPRRILIDAGEPNIADYENNLKKVLDEEKAQIEKVIITHWHHDHIGGVPNVLKLTKDCSVLKFPNNVEESYVKLTDGEIVTTEGASLRIWHTPGHTVDHIVIVLEEESALFSGDCILGEGTAVFETLYDYMKSLDKILTLKPKIIYPGHGPIIEDPLPKIQYYINHRNEREQQIFQCLQGSQGKGLSDLEIVRTVYSTTPEHLHIAAANNVKHHLEKLKTEGKVTCVGNLWTLNEKSNL